MIPLIPHDPFNFFFFDLTTAILFIENTQWENGRYRGKTSSQIPWNSKSGFLLPPLAGFPWQLSCSVCFCELIRSSWVTCPSPFICSSDCFPLLFFLSGHYNSPPTMPHTLPPLTSCLFTLIWKKTGTVSKCQHRWCLQETNHTQREHSALSSRKAWSWREYFTAVVRIEVVGGLFLPPPVRRIGLSNQSWYFFFSVWFRRLYIRGRHL